MTFEETLCAWAADKYGLKDVVEVTFDVDGFGGSDVTPPGPWSLEVMVKRSWSNEHRNGQVQTYHDAQTFAVDDIAGMIREITERFHDENPAGSW